MTASILEQLLALYFAITYSWQRFYRFRFLLHGFFFFIFSYAKCMLYSKQPTIFLARRHLNTMFLTNFENLNSISNIFQEHTIS